MPPPSSLSIELIQTSDAAPPASAMLSLDQLVRHSPVGIALIDHEGVYRVVNPAYAAIYGYPVEAMLGQAFTMVFAPEQRARVQDLHRRFLVEGGELKGEWEVVRRDGQVLNVIAESVRVPGEGGLPQRLAYVVDITERKRMENDLRASRLFAQSVIDGLGALVCVLDQDGLILSVNRAWRRHALAQGVASSRTLEGANYLWACEHPDAPDAPAIDISGVGRAGQAPFASRLRALLAGEGGSEGFRVEYPSDSAAGQRWFMVEVSMLTGSLPPRFVVAHEDISALKQTQAALQQREALLLDLAASIPGASFRMTVDAQGTRRYTYMSPGVRQLFGVEPQQACEDNALLRDLILAEDLPSQAASVRQAIANEQTWESEYRIRTPAGEEKWVQARATPQRGADGSVTWTGLLTDISDRKRIEAVLRNSEETYRTLFETVPTGVVYQDAQGHITAANPAAQRILGLSLDQMQGRSSIDPRWKAIRPDGSDFPGDEHPAMVALRTGQPVRGVPMGVLVPDQGYVWIMVNAIPLFKNGQLVEVYASFEDITQRVQLDKELKLQATTDFLTGVLNRRSFMEQAITEFERLRRHPDRIDSVLALDLDHFKLVNDTHGHAAGDAVLRHFASLMRQMIRRSDLLGRSGGEEFLILLPDTAPQAAAALADRLRERCAATPAIHESLAISFTVSIGVAAILPSDASIEASLVRADAALYEAKRGGRNRVCIKES